LIGRGSAAARIGWIEHGAYASNFDKIDEVHGSNDDLSVLQGIDDCALMEFQANGARRYSELHFSHAPGVPVSGHFKGRNLMEAGRPVDSLSDTGITRSDWMRRNSFRYAESAICRTMSPVSHGLHKTGVGSRVCDKEKMGRFSFTQEIVAAPLEEVK
jgi:hypothetical protein